MTRYRPVLVLVAVGFAAAGATVISRGSRPRPDGLCIDEPPGVSVVADVATAGGNGEHRVVNRGTFWELVVLTSLSEHYSEYLNPIVDGLPCQDEASKRWARKSPAHEVDRRRSTVAVSQTLNLSSVP